VTILNGNNGKKKVKAKATVQATIPLTMNQATFDLR
jgi:hypothetical protein